MAAIFQMTFSNAFSWMKMYEFPLRFTEFYSSGFDEQYSSIVSDNGLAPFRRQAIIWNDDGYFTDAYTRPQWVSNKSALIEIVAHSSNSYTETEMLLTVFPSLAVPKIVKMTTFDAASNENFVKMMIFLFQCMGLSGIIQHLQSYPRSERQSLAARGSYLRRPRAKCSVRSGSQPGEKRNHIFDIQYIEAWTKWPPFFCSAFFTELFKNVIQLPWHLFTRAQFIIILKVKTVDYTNEHLPNTKTSKPTSFAHKRNPLKRIMMTQYIFQNFHREI